MPTTRFVTDFTFQLVDPNADGFTFVIQGGAPTALGGSGDALGYGGMKDSVALKFDLHNNSGEGNNSTGTYIDGALPTIPSINLDGTGINLHSGHIFAVHLVYNGTEAVATFTDTVTHVAVTGQNMGNISQILGKNAAYFGFTGGTGAQTATQNILTWTYSGGVCSTAP